MTRLSNISCISSVFIIFLFVLYLTQPPTPPLLRYRRQLGPFLGYKDCAPARQVVLLHHTQGKYTRVVENILGRLALTNNLSYHLGQGGSCTGIFVGIQTKKPLDTEDMCSFKIVRDTIGDEPFMVTLLGESENTTTYHSEGVRQTLNKTKIEELDKIIDLGIIAKQFTESLIVLKQLLCLDFRDITYLDTITGVENEETENNQLYNHFARKLQKIVSELGQDVVGREMSILGHANSNLRTNCNQTRPERYSGVADTEQLEMCHLMKYNATDLTKMVP